MPHVREHRLGKEDNAVRITRVTVLATHIASNGAETASSSSTIIVLARRRGDERPHAYFAQTLSEDKTKNAAMRCLKRRLVDVLFRASRDADTSLSAAA